jgi:hypothetical protein
MLSKINHILAFPAPRISTVHHTAHAAHTIQAFLRAAHTVRYIVALDVVGVSHRKHERHSQLFVLPHQLGVQRMKVSEAR